MKHPKEEANRLCASCRRVCKQPARAVIASCPRYYPRPKIKGNAWKQQELPFIVTSNKS